MIPGGMPALVTPAIVLSTVKYGETSRVVRLATRASNAIGNGLYGVDLKVVKDRTVIIEVNDNPSIDAGVEDAYLGEDLYRRIMEEFLRRLERKRLGVRD